MSSTRNKVFCQNCRTANVLSRELCAQCGMRLMLIATPAVARHEDSAAQHIHEEHLLERISVLENHLAQLTEKVSQTLNLLLRQAHTAHLDQTLLEALIEVLGHARMIDGRQLQTIWHQRSGEKTIVEPAEKIREFAREKILSEYRGDREDEFARLVGEAVDFIGRGKLCQGAVAFDRAARLDCSNSGLNFVIGNLLFAARQLAAARRCLQRALSAEPRSARAALLLGLIAAEAGELDKAETLLAKSLRQQQNVFAAHCARGLLRVLRKKWASALVDFKRAHAVRPGAASLFLLGLAQYHGGRYLASLTALEQAAVLEPQQAIIAYWQGLVLLKLKQRARAQQLFALSARLDPRRRLYRAASRLPSAKKPLLPQLFTDPHKLKLAQPAKFVYDAIFEDAVELDVTKSTPPVAAVD